MKNLAIVFAIVGILIFYFWDSRKSIPTDGFQSDSPAETVTTPSSELSQQQSDLPDLTAEKAESTPRQSQALPKTPDMPRLAQNNGDKKNLVKFRVEDGLAVMGDIVLGAPAFEHDAQSGYAEAPKIKLWKNGVIPFHIQPTVKNPERITEALSYFQNTVVTFVEYDDQEDAVVFESKPGTCKSYLGKIGGKQPIWISDDCSPGNIAHEIMHALGFVHEQNRSDRDSYIEVLWDNIEDEFRYNFERFPQPLMLASGKSPFDYESIMMYPPTTFAKNPSNSTMRSKTSSQILPKTFLSDQDVLRINRLYGN